MSPNNVRRVKSRRPYDMLGIQLGWGRIIIHAEFLFGGGEEDCLENVHTLWDNYPKILVLTCQFYKYIVIYKGGRRDE
jgi:hypothetical protein